MAHIIGYKSLFMHVMEVREIMQDVKETIYGNRMDLAANCIGGVKYSVNLELIDFIDHSINRLEKHVEEIIKIYRTDKMILTRTQNVGVINADDVKKYGLVGPVARGSGIATDTRKDAPYLVYDKLDFDLITEQGGDVHSRAMVRLREVMESIKIIRQIIKIFLKKVNFLPYFPTFQLVKLWLVLKHQEANSFTMYAQMVLICLYV